MDEMTDSGKPERGTGASPLSDAMEMVFQTKLPIRPQEPSLHDYYGDLRQPPRLAKYVRYHEEIIRFADFDPNGKDVLEVGSGFGLVLLWLASSGARAHGIELVSWMVDDVHTYLARLPAELKNRITVRQGGASHLAYEDSRFDLVLSVEALSHYLDYQPFLGEAHRVLRRGGKLVVVDGNNGLNLSTRRYCERIWALHERDLDDENDPWLFVPKRQRMIRESFPQLDASEAHALALRTAGMVRDEIQDAVQGYLDSGKLPQNLYEPGQLSVHPEHEMVMERLFNPFSLAREIRSYGFETRLQGYWGGASGRPIVRTANRLLAAMSPVAMPTAPSFRIVATKH
jgi:ubiquinone/menaquinone biosynthesis C-methylase UbiE